MLSTAMLRLVWNLCLFKARPEEIPFSFTLLVVAGLVNFGSGFLLIAMATGSLPAAVWKSLLLILITTLFTRALLQFFNFSERFVQTLSGLLATQGFILILAMLPYRMILSLLPDISSPISYTIGMGVSGLLLVIASIWLFLNYATIFESALETSDLIWIIIFLR
jgi:hypothetical protein